MKTQMAIPTFLNTFFFFYYCEYMIYLFSEWLLICFYFIYTDDEGIVESGMWQEAYGLQPLATYTKYENDMYISIGRPW